MISKNVDGTDITGATGLQTPNYSFAEWAENKGKIYDHKKKSVK
ncbi:hypothetical protein [Flavobacterium sp. NRK F10]|nr:hypothetical protein [Flavobacterium sp. NRK F10]